MHTLVAYLYFVRLIAIATSASFCHWCHFNLLISQAALVGPTGPQQFSFLSAILHGSALIAQIQDRFVGLLDVILRSKSGTRKTENSSCLSKKSHMVREFLKKCLQIMRELVESLRRCWHLPHSTPISRNIIFAASDRVPTRRRRWRITERLSAWPIRPSEIVHGKTFRIERFRITFTRCQGQDGHIGELRLCLIRL